MQKGWWAAQIRLGSGGSGPSDLDPTTRIGSVRLGAVACGLAGGGLAVGGRTARTESAARLRSKAAQQAAPHAGGEQGWRRTARVHRKWCSGAQFGEGFGRGERVGGGELVPGVQGVRCWPERGLRQRGVELQLR